MGRLEEHDAKFVKAEEIFVGHLNDSASNFAQVQISIADQIASSDSHFIQVETSIGNHISNTTNHFIKLENEILNINGSLPKLPGKWSGGSYSILANGECPEGFTRHYGHLRAIKMYECDDYYIEESQFGDSAIKVENCDYNYSELDITACCK